MLQLKELLDLTWQVFNQIELEVLLEEYGLLHGFFALFICGCHFSFI